MRYVVTAIALVLFALGASTGHDRLGQRRNADVGAPGQPSTGSVSLLLGSPDINVLTERLVPTARAARSAGARYLQFYCSPNGLATACTPQLLSILGKPVSIVLSIWSLSALSADVPAVCVADWRVFACRQAIRNQAEAFARANLSSGDYFFGGLEAEEYFRLNPGDIAAGKAMYREVLNVVRQVVPGVRTGVVFGYGSGDHALLTSLWDASYGTLCLNAYEAFGAGPTVTGSAAAIAAMESAVAFGRTLTPDVGLCEVGYPTAASVGGSTAAQAEVYTALRALARDRSLAIAVAFLALDCRLPVVNGQPCYEAAERLGFNPAVDNGEDYIGTMGVVETTGQAKPGWYALWGL